MEMRTRDSDATLPNTLEDRSKAPSEAVTTTDQDTERDMGEDVYNIEPRDAIDSAHVDNFEKRHSRSIAEEPGVVSDVPDVGPPPDGGLQAWNCAISASFVTFCLMGFGKSFHLPH